MKNKGNILIISIIISLSACGICLSAEPRGTVAFPYVADVTADDVYVRSGPGTAYYFTGKLNESDQIIVVGQKYGWMEIMPPNGSFSWISKNYVEQDTNNPQIGIVSGDSVRVWAGSPNQDPMRSSSLQTKLDKGDTVKLTGEEVGDYYKIDPPAGAHLWINNRYLKYVSQLHADEAEKKSEESEITIAVDEFEPAEKSPEKKSDAAAEVKPEAKPAERKAAETEPSEPKKAAATETEKADETEVLAQIYKLSEEIDAEMLKPIDNQNYVYIKKRLQDIAEASPSERAEKYADYQLDRIKAYELAIKADRQLEQQDEELERKLREIEKQYESEIAGLPSTGIYIAVGKLQESHIYTGVSGRKRFFLTGREGSIICYAVAEYEGLTEEAELYVNEVVGLVGKAASDQNSPAVLVEFTDIDIVDNFAD